MEKEYTILKMVTNIRDHITKDKEKGMASTLTIMDVFMKAIGKIIKKKAKENISSLMVPSISALSKTP